MFQHDQAALNRQIVGTSLGLAKVEIAAGFVGCRTSRDFKAAIDNETFVAVIADTVERDYLFPKFRLGAFVAVSIGKRYVELFANRAAVTRGRAESVFVEYFCLLPVMRVAYCCLS